jgi:2-iminobutanoate/2-iminopropanoate deaminase
MRRRIGFSLLSLCLVHVTLGADTPASQAPQASSSARRVVAPPGVPVAGSYSAGVQAGRRLFLSGQLGRDPKTGELLPGIREQTRQAMQNIGAVLGAAGMDFRHLVKCHVYLASMDDYVGMNETYARFFSGRVPARTTVEAAGLPRDAAVEIGCIAYGELAGISVVEPPTGTLPTPLGPYSAGVWAGDTLYLSGMGGQFPEGRRLPDPLRDQVRQALVNIRTTLTAAQLGAADVVSSLTYFTGADLAVEGAADYDAMFPSMVPPPRTTLVLPRLPGAIKTEITFVAVKPTVTRQLIRDGKTAGARGVLAGDLLYTRAESAKEAGPDIETQARATFARLRDTVQEAGLRWSDVLHVNVYLADLADFAAMDRVFRATFEKDPPARTTIRVQAGEGTRIQLSLVAVK